MSFVVELQYCIVAVSGIESYIVQRIDYSQGCVLPVALNRHVDSWRVYRAARKLKVKIILIFMDLSYRPTVFVLKLWYVFPFKFCLPAFMDNNVISQGKLY